ncbi:hypothetical protein BurJ1DRAFT_1581 [Burkholderiales bacterium JOSHI_001]|nr:hypothetical protein BurJ1DRAFT_1581 [Burkholderiales bacterium JOSHI_001]
MRYFPDPLARLRRQRLPLWLAWLLALCLLGAQGLGQGHALAHGHGLPNGLAVAAPASDALADDAASGPSLFAGHEAGSATCRLLDQLAPDALVLPALALPQALPVAPACTPVSPSPRVLPAPCLPQARAPPMAACA